MLGVARSRNIPDTFGDASSHLDLALPGAALPIVPFTDTKTFTAKAMVARPSTGRHPQAGPNEQMLYPSRFGWLVQFQPVAALRARETGPAAHYLTTIRQAVSDFDTYYADPKLTWLSSWLHLHRLFTSPLAARTSTVSAAAAHRGYARVLPLTADREAGIFL